MLLLDLFNTSDFNTMFVNVRVTDATHSMIHPHSKGMNLEMKFEITPKCVYIASTHVHCYAIA